MKSDYWGNTHDEFLHWDWGSTDDSGINVGDYSLHPKEKITTIPQCHKSCKLKKEGK